MGEALLDGFTVAGGYSEDITDNLVSDNTVTTSTGVVVFNGTKAFLTANTAYEVTYRGIAGKGFVFEYNYSGDCASGTKKMTVACMDRYTIY
jgi:hypothetical protein